MTTETSLKRYENYGSFLSLDAEDCLEIDEREMLEALKIEEDIKNLLSDNIYNSIDFNIDTGCGESDYY